jgi:hypothetical protein
MSDWVGWALVIANATAIFILIVQSLNIRDLTRAIEHNTSAIEHNTDVSTNAITEIKILSARITAQNPNE